MRIFRVINLKRNNFHDILHCIGWFPPGGFILVQQCCDFALYMSSTGEPVFCTLHCLCFCSHLNLKHSAFRGGDLLQIFLSRSVLMCAVCIAGGCQMEFVAGFHLAEFWQQSLDFEKGIPKVAIL